MADLPVHPDYVFYADASVDGDGEVIPLKELPDHAFRGGGLAETRIDGVNYYVEDWYFESAPAWMLRD